MSTRRLPGSSDVIDAEVIATRPVGSRTAYQHPDGFVHDIAVGMKSIFWGITHPWKSAKYAFGAFCGLCGAVALIGGGAHLIAGQPGTAQLNGLDPTSAGRVGADALRPVVMWGAQSIDAGLNGTTTLVDAAPVETAPEAVEYRR